MKLVLINHNIFNFKYFKSTIMALISNASSYGVVLVHPQFAEPRTIVVIIIIELNKGFAKRYRIRRSC